MHHYISLLYKKHTCIITSYYYLDYVIKLPFSLSSYAPLRFYFIFIFIFLSSSINLPPQKNPGSAPGSISITSSMLTKKIQMKDVVDQQLPFPSLSFEEVVVSILKMARACLHADPQSRRTMHIVLQLLSTRATSLSEILI